MSDFLIDNFVTVAPGEPYRLFPFGVISKGGKKRTITPDFARRFKLPHFKPAIKLGSHDDATPAGGSIIGLEVREDGLYAVPEFTQRGIEAMSRGDYRYHSPEVIWEGGIEDATTGEVIPGPLIIGDALLHTPALGEAAALYTIEEVTNMDETVNVPKNFWDKLMERFDALFVTQKPEPEPDPEPVQEEKPDQFAALQAQAEQYKAELEAIKAESARLEAERAEADKLTAIAEDLRADRFGGQFGEPAEAAKVLAGMTAEQREWCYQQFAALAAKIDTAALYSEKGSKGEALPGDPVAALDVAIQARMAERKEDYGAALLGLRAEKPELFATYATKKGG